MGPIAIRHRPPRVVIAAAMCTWVAATGIAATTALLALGHLLAIAVLLAPFNGPAELVWGVAGEGAAILSVCVGADLVALFVYRGQRWARWTLICLSACTVLGGLLAFQLIFPLALSLIAVAVIGLLLLPAADAWFAPDSPDR